MFCPRCEQESASDVMVCRACDYVRGDGLQDLFGLGRTTNYSFAMGPAEFWVREEDADNVRVLLQGLITAGEKPADRS